MERCLRDTYVSALHYDWNGQGLGAGRHTIHTLLQGTRLGLEAGLGDETWTPQAGMGHCGQGLRGGCRMSRDKGSPTWVMSPCVDACQAGTRLGGTTGEWRDASRGTPD